MTEGKKGLDQREIKGDTKDCFIFESLFSSEKLEAAAMYVSADIIGMVKNNTKGFCKYTIYKLTNDFSEVITLC